MIAFAMKTLPIFCACAIGLIGIARAEVQETRENGFVVQSVVTADAPPSSVYRDLIRVA